MVRSGCSGCCALTTPKNESARTQRSVIRIMALEVIDFDIDGSPYISSVAAWVEETFAAQPTVRTRLFRSEQRSTTEHSAQHYFCDVRSSSFHVFTFT